MFRYETRHSGSQVKNTVDTLWLIVGGNTVLKVRDFGFTGLLELKAN